MLRLWGIASKATEERDGRELGAAVSLAREVVCSDADRKTRRSARHLLETYEPILKNGSARWHDWGAPEWATPPPAARPAESLRTQPLGATARDILKTTFFSVVLLLVAPAVAWGVALVVYVSGAPDWLTWLSCALALGTALWLEARLLAPHAYPQWQAVELFLPFIIFGAALWGMVLVPRLVWLAITRRKWPSAAAA